MSKYASNVKRNRSECCFFFKKQTKNKDKAPNCINYQYKAVVALCCGAVSLPILLVHKVDIVSKDRLNF